MSDHEYFEQLCAAGIDGALTAAEREKLEAHLAECPACAALERDLRAMQALLAVPDEPPAALHERIMESARQQTRLRVVQPEKPARRLPVFTMLAAAAVVVLVVLGGGVGQMFNMGAGQAAGEAAAAGDSAAMAAPAAGGMAEQIERAAEAASGETGMRALDAGGTTDAAKDTGASAQAEGETAAEAPADMSVAAAAPAQVQSAEEQEEQAAPAAMPFAAMPAIRLPDSLQGTSAAHCYLAQGAGELPDIGGELLMQEDGVAVFSLTNSMGVIEDTLRAVEEAGYDVSAYDDVGLTIDSKAEKWILIVVSG